MGKALGFLLATTSIFAGCGGSGGKEADKTQTFSGYEYVVISQADLALTDGSLSGEGVIAFKEPLGAVSSNKNFQVSFQLEDGAFAELRTYADKTLNDGIQVRVSRAGDSLSLTATVGDKEAVSRDLTSLPADERLTISVDVHNTETPAHVLVWENTESAPTDDNAIFNSDADGVIPGNGAGMFWGLALRGAKVFLASMEPARFSH